MLTYKNIVIFLGIIIAAIFFMPACGIVHYEKNFNPAPIDKNYLPEVRIIKEVALIPELQGNPTEVLVLANGSHKWYANTKELTDIAVKVAHDILRQNNVDISDIGPKVLKISFVNTSYESGWWATQINFDFMVKAGDEIVKTIRGYQNIGRTSQTHWAIEASVSHAMINVFKDPEILEYLKN